MAADLIERRAALRSKREAAIDKFSTACQTRRILERAGKDTRDAFKRECDALAELIEADAAHANVRADFEQR